MPYLLFYLYIYSLSNYINYIDAWYLFQTRKDTYV